MKRLAGLIMLAVFTVSVFVGCGGGGGGDGATARFANPFGITTDGTNLFVADSFNHTIRGID